MNVQKKGEWLELIVPKEWNGITIEHLFKEIWQVPKAMLHQFRMEKSAKLNGNIYPWSQEINMGDRLQVHLFPREEYGVEPNFLELNILYEDDHVLIVNKPAQMETHPAVIGQTNTLANAVAYYFMENGIETKVRHIHRLDKDTTGAVLFAKNPLAGAIMDRLLEQRIIKRTYLALVHGKPNEKKRMINAPIGKDRHHSQKRRVSSTGKEAITSYEIIEYYPKTNTTLVKLQLHTGRTHQIRVHLSHIGNPLIGDKLYGNDIENTKYPRQALHAAKISLPHPITNKEVICIAPFLDIPPIFEYNVNELL